VSVLGQRGARRLLAACSRAWIVEEREVRGILAAVNLVDELHAIAGALRSAGVRHAVCGGLAVTLHGATRMTKAIDLLVAATVFTGLLDDTLEVRTPNGTLTVISRAGLIKMMQLAGRPQDVADLASLEGNHDE
jgi:hypothetical protein